MADTISERTSVARKRHYCDSCCRNIEPGQKYASSFLTDGGDHWTYKEHEWCRTAASIVNAHLVFPDEYVRVCDFEEEDRETVRAEAIEVYALLWPTKDAYCPPFEQVDDLTIGEGE